MIKVPRAIVYSAVLSVGCWGQSSGGGQLPQSKDKSQLVAGQMRAGEKQAAPTTLHLATVENVVAKTEIAIVFAELSCDEDGNIYLASEIPGKPIRELNPKGELAATFNLNADPDVDVYGNGPFALSVDGELYTWVGNRRDRNYYVLVFGADGKYKRKIKLDTDFAWQPGPFAVFRNGNLLMTGQEYDRDIRRPKLPFTAIFRSDGKLLKELSLEDDERIHKLILERDPMLTSAAAPTNNRAVAFGHIEPARDGNIYIMRWLSPTVIYAVSPGGEVVRRVTVDPGGTKLMPLQMHVAGNRIAILFRNEGTKEQRMKIVDLDGKEVATYDATGTNAKESLGGAFACYLGKTERFSFLATDEDHRIVFRIAEPR